MYRFSVRNSALVEITAQNFSVRNFVVFEISFLINSIFEYERIRTVRRGYDQSKDYIFSFSKHVSDPNLNSVIISTHQFPFEKFQISAL